MGCKKFLQLLLCRGDVEVPDKNVCHECILFLIFYEMSQSGTKRSVKGDPVAGRLFESTSEWLHVLSLQPLGTLRHVELHGLTFLKTLETTRLDCREVHKNILTALTADEAVAFGVVEPLHCSLFCHIDTCVPLIDLRWRDSEVLKAGYWLVGRELLTTDSVKRSLHLTRPKNDWQTRLG
jgi:hypothetical protein